MRDINSENKSPVNSNNFESTARSSREEKRQLKLSGIVKKLIVQNARLAVFETFINSSLS